MDGWMYLWMGGSFSSASVTLRMALYKCVDDDDDDDNDITLNITPMHLPGMIAGVTVSQLKTYRAIQEVAAESNVRSSSLRSMVRRVA